jgi:cystathionine gamma-lyase / homocysteine desulfhydrase
MTAKKKYHVETEILHQKIDNQNVFPVITPLYQNSAFSSDSPYFYTRKNNPNCEELENVVKSIDGAKHAISTTTGMAAVSLVLNMLKPGDHIVLNRLVYGCTYKLFQRIAGQRNFKLTILDLTDEHEIEQVPGEVSMVFFETPTNPFLKTVPIRKVADKVKKLNQGALIVVDNTWATPLQQKALNYGADVAVYSMTKYFSGHSDVMGGMGTTNSDEIGDFLRTQRFYLGCILDPHSAWLLRRSMFTFSLRMKEHEERVKIFAEFLQELPQIKKVYYPELNNGQLEGYGCILFFEIQDELVGSYKEFSQALNLFDTGTGMACVTSMIAQPYTGSHASMTDQEKKEMGLGKNLIRLCFGMENVEDLKNDIIQAFKQIEESSQSVQYINAGNQ